MRSRRQPYVVGVALAFVIAIVLVTALRSNYVQPPSVPIPPSEGPKDNVAVVSATVTVTLALDATTVAYPAFTLSSPTAGEVRRAKPVRRGQSFRSGEVLFRVGKANTAVRTATPGRFRRWLIPDKAEGIIGAPVLEADYNGFGLVASLPPASAYRLLEGQLSARASLVGGPAGFECTVLQAPLRSHTPPSADAAASSVVCAIPPNIRAYGDVSGQIALRSGQVDNVPTLPVTAVSGSADEGEVSLVLPDGSVAIRRVELGATDGAIVEIRAGLQVGDHVLTNPPPLVR